jgi:uncharacterized protein (TIGR03000 family)
MYKPRLFGLALAATALLWLLTPGQSQAWGWGGGWYGYGGYPGYYSYGYYPGYWGGYYPSYSYGYSPYYSPYSYYGYPSYAYSSYSYPSPYGYSYYNPSTATYAAAPQSGQYQSFYYAPNADAQDRRAHVEVLVPQNAEVWFDDHKTQESGTDRFFVSPPVDPNSRYFYNIRARWTDNGRTVERTRKVSFQPGQQIRVDFMREQAGDQQPAVERREATPRPAEENTPAPPPPPPSPPPFPPPPPPAAFYGHRGTGRSLWPSDALSWKKIRPLPPSKGTIYS